MTHSAKILADSISPDGERLTTFEVTFPRIVLAEFNTHRQFSRNSASSRAIPVEKMIRMVQEHPYVPTHWGKNQKGMQADEELAAFEQKAARAVWNGAIQEAITQAKELVEIGVHKQIANRLLEPFMWHTVIVTATEWDNFFHLRCHHAAHPEIRRAAELMRDVMEQSEPRLVRFGGWHLPLIQLDEHVAQGLDEEQKKAWLEHLCKVSVGRCARVSYLTHDGRRDPKEDVALCDRLLASGHMSPFEHVARPSHPDDPPALRLGMAGATVQGTGAYEAMKPIWWCGNFRGWVPFRKLIPNEHDILGAR